MSEEEKIIIDGVDVSECEWFGCTGYSCTDEYKDYICKNNSDCYFKQLKRLEQENKKLLEINDDIKDRYCELYKNADQLTNKTYRYKQALEKIREITDEYITDCMGSKCEGMEEIQNKINEVLNDN